MKMSKKEPKKKLINVTNVSYNYNKKDLLEKIKKIETFGGDSRSQ